MVNYRPFIAAGIIAIFAFLLSFIWSPLTSWISSMTGGRVGALNTNIIFCLIGAAIVIGVSGFLPPKWGREFVKVALILVFIAGLWIEALLIISYNYTPPEVSIEECKNFVIPETNDTTQITVNGVKYVSCVLTGYYPATTKITEIGWVTFYIFYIILPFAFIFALVYGLMNGLGFESFFGAVTKPVVIVLTFVISMYATRLLFGHLLLQLLGYGAWGLAAVFIAVIITGGLWKLMSGLYPVITPLLEEPALARAEWIIGRLTNPETFRVLSEKEKKELEKELEQLAVNYPSVRRKVNEVFRRGGGGVPAPSH